MRREDAKASSRVAPQDIISCPGNFTAGTGFFIFSGTRRKGKRYVYSDKTMAIPFMHTEIAAHKAFTQ